jgi:predicted site-specific integrase-resolvase
MKAKQVLKLLNITRPTLSKYVKIGKIKVQTTVSGQYIYDAESVYNIINKDKPRKHVAYCRVSSSSQKKDLENQIDTVTSFMIHNGIQIDSVYSDIKSGMTLDRPQFSKLMESVFNNEIDTIYVSYKDRLTRLSYDMVTSILMKFGVNVIVISEIDNPKSSEQEFLEEIVTLIHSQSMKMYSKRRKEKLELVSKDLQLESEVKI